MQAIEAQPSNALAYESRANAHIKLENYLEAAEDAAKAIELNPTSKAYLRRGWVGLLEGFLPGPVRALNHLQEHV